MPSSTSSLGPNGSREQCSEWRLVLVPESNLRLSNEIFDVLLDSFDGRSFDDAISVNGFSFVFCDSEGIGHLIDLTIESYKLLDLIGKKSPSSGNKYGLVTSTCAQAELALLEQSLKNQQAFISQLTHELRTPLAIAVGSLRRASLRSAEMPSNSVEHMQVASQELKRMARLIDHLTLLTDIDTGSQRWNVRPVKIEDVLTLWLEEISVEARQQLIVVVDERVAGQFINVDPEALIIVLNNLLDNSLRYSPEGSPVVFLLDADVDRVNFFIADWGYGIPQNLLEHVFDRFRRLEEHRDPARADGSGLGLAVSRELLELMGGEIFFLPLQSLSNPGDPSTIGRLCFPIVQTDAKPSAFQLDPALLNRTEAKLKAVDQLIGCLRRVADDGQCP